MPRRVGLLEQAADTAFALADAPPGLPAGAIAWDGAAIARLRPGAGLTRPAVDVIDSEFLDGAQRERVRLRLQAWIDALVARELAPLFAAVSRADGDAALRGPLHRLLESGGVCPGTGADGEAPDLRGRLRAAGARAGRFALYVPELLRPRPARLRALLWAVWARQPMPDLPNPSLVSIAAPDHAGFLVSQGWVQAGPVLLRLDVAERVAAELAAATRRRPAPLPYQLSQRLGLRADMLPAVLRGLGMRVLPAPALPPAAYGPPAPPMIAAARRRAVAAPARPARPDHPFAALATLRR